MTAPSTPTALPTPPSVVAERTPGAGVLIDVFTPKSTLGTVTRHHADPQALARERSIRSHAAYQRLSPGDKGVADWIIWKASSAEPKSRLYYLDKLQTLFDTPSVQPDSEAAAELEAQANAKADAALVQERARDPALKGDEERLSAAALFSTRLGRGGILYRVDARDPRAVVVKIKLQLHGPPAFVAKIKELEDSIEKRASGRGYTLDVEFVEKGGADVFRVNADPRQWPTSKNLTGEVDALAHEIHHLLGLGDRYDYIERHAANQHIAVDQRLYLFAFEMQKPPDPRGFASLMAGSNGSFLSEDVCAVVQTNPKECLDVRKEFDPANLPALDFRSIQWAR